MIIRSLIFCTTTDQDLVRSYSNAVGSDQQFIPPFSYVAHSGRPPPRAAAFSWAAPVSTYRSTSWSVGRSLAALQAVCTSSTLVSARFLLQLLLPILLLPQTPVAVCSALVIGDTEKTVRVFEFGSSSSDRNRKHSAFQCLYKPTATDDRSYNTLKLSSCTGR